MMYLVKQKTLDGTVEETVHPNLGRALLWCRGLGSMGLLEGTEPLRPLEVGIAREHIKAYGCAEAAIFFYDPDSMAPKEWATVSPAKEPSLADCQDAVVLQQLGLGLRSLDTIARQAQLGMSPTRRALDRLVEKNKAVREKTPRGAAWRRR